MFALEICVHFGKDKKGIARVSNCFWEMDATRGSREFYRSLELYDDS